MSKRSKKNASPAVETAIDAATDTSNAAVEALLDAADPAPAADEIDAEILAMLGDDSVETPVAAVTDPEPVADSAVDVTDGEPVETVATDDVEVTIEAEDEDAILAELDDDDAATPATTAAKPARKKREPKAPAVATRAFTDVAAIDPAAFKTNLDGCTAKKVNEKVQNLISAVEMGKTLSRYTQVAVKRLVQDGKISGKSLVEAFQAEGLSIGTARAQSQQMTALFKVTGLVTPAQDNQRELILADQSLADELVKLAA